ncbi:uncharacterized protein lrrc53 isoform X1 [Thunnus maccoyii]|uniref:uncharacterized protein lrrc53 isoform X1 n=1 Tax=Thunnus maccoyii TaxID=8240 RepID=UPI001C4AECA5|nr:uncharacterized protein lrrc53 isoform X1 [Thunnus maccoyii]XP_042285327.1 uncharacterized protein lrrc53 isoform X1 [Thunnus maccoyii]XP_042285328.1 uncharacterized protein lrrc53 isoform X1 [Thunnus maccoyii]
MNSILLMLLLSVISAQRVSSVPSCPASCVVCSEDAVICHRLAHIIDAPDTTQALLLTEGSISTVQPASLSDLSNITVIGLSHNHISVLGKESFRNLPFLHTLLLDHNLLTSQALQGGALTNLTQLEVLALGHNLISMIQAGWLKGTKALRSLKLEGNQLTSLDSGSFPLNDLRDLESLDVSDNQINHLDRNSFRGLVGLRTLDLSRNRLSSAPAEAFSYLTWLTNLNLDLNSWNCSCQLLDLAAFLSTFIQQPDQILYNGRRMVCVSADNPAVTTVLELTEANCVPSNQNITVQIQTRGSVMPQLYARDLAITAVICFIGGVGLTLLVVLIYYQVSHRKKLKQSEGQREKEEENSTVANQLVNHHNVSEMRGDLFLQANNSQPWDKETMLDTRTEGHGGQFRSRADENDSHFRCPDCRSEGPRLNPMRWDNRVNGGIESEEDRERRRVRMMMMEEERRKPGTHQEILGRDVPNKLLSRSNSNSSFHPRRETFSQRPETLVAYKTHREMGESYRTNVEGKSRGQEMTHCESCHRTYRPSEHNMRQGRIHTNMRDSALFDGFPPQHRLSDRGRNVSYNQFDMMKDMDFRRETRNVTFDLESSSTQKEKGNNQGRGRKEEEAKTSRDKERGRERKHKAKVQSSRLLKVKLNLSPLRKSKVHPKRKTERGHLEKSSSKKSEEKRRDGKERREKEGRGSSGKKTKENIEKVKKTAKAKGLIEDDAEEKEDEEGEQKSKSSSKQKKTTLKSGKGGQESAEGDQGEKTHLENSQHTSSDTTNAADQSYTTRVEGATIIGQGPGLQGADIPYQGAGLVLGSAQLSSQHPFSMSASERNCTTNLSLLGSAGSQLTGSNLCLQGGNFLLNTTAPVSNALYPSGPTNTVAPSIAISGPNMVPSGAPNSFSRQTSVGLMSPATSLLANAVQANPLQASAIQTIPLYNSQARGLAQNLAANPAINPSPIQSLSQSQMPPDSSPLVARLKPDPTQGPGPQTGEGLHQLPPESQTKESFTLPTQAPLDADDSSGVTPQVTGPLTTVENLSNNNSQTENGRVPAGLMVSMSAGGVALTEGSTVGLSGGSMPAAADVSVSGVSAQSEYSTCSPAAAAALLQQEYLPEDGGSSPRRKLRLVLPEKTSSRPPTALERKIR